MIPSGSKRMYANFRTKVSSGTPYWRPIEIAVANAFIMPLIVEPSFPMSVRKISPSDAVLVLAGRDVALVAADRELVRERLALARHPAPHRARRLDAAAASAASSAVFVPPSVFSACAVFEPSR